ncbi:universal stress protein [Roseovarius amoyensis]|uniref:universal stress protein n=1 Tax=Roseovarius amoyensis TaxID=2211448 RepID=UPI0013A6DD3E|nr:universal stress protein [Roseovarius amoyensis]
MSRQGLFSDPRQVQIRAVHVLEPPIASVRTCLDDGAVANLRAGAQDALAARVMDHPEIEAALLSGNPPHSIIADAEKTGADCIIAGSHRPGLRDYLLGSTAARVVRHAPCAVHVLRQ